MIREHTVSVGGRRLAVLDGGHEGGPAVFVSHGTPSSGLLWKGSLEDAEARGLRLLGYDRPGYGGSDPHPGRRVGDAATDTAAIADALGIERFAVEGGSGGGPHALACAALLPDRVVAAACQAGIAPYPADGLDWLAGMGQANLDEFAAALEGREALEAFNGREAEALLASGPEAFADELRSLLSPADAEALTGEFAAFLLEATRRALVNGVEGWVEDDFAFLTPWGFDLGDIRVPVQLWHGAQDMFAPIAHGRWLSERIPGVEAHLSEEDGHFSVQIGRIGAVHEWLLGYFEDAQQQV
jgi:pimeloyl-ACP methyl ester carboxylesterase